MREQNFKRKLKLDSKIINKVCKVFPRKLPTSFSKNLINNSFKPTFAEKDKKNSFKEKRRFFFEKPSKTYKNPIFAEHQKNF